MADDVGGSPLLSSSNSNVFQYSKPGSWTPRGGRDSAPSFPKKGLHSVLVDVADGLSWVVLLMGHLPAGFWKAFESVAIKGCVTME